MLRLILLRTAIDQGFRYVIQGGSSAVGGAMIDAVTIEDAKRVARRLYGGGMLVTVAGRPKGLTSSETTE